MKDHWITVGEIVNEVGISLILYNQWLSTTDTFGMQCVSRKFVPTILIHDQKDNCLQAVCDILWTWMKKKPL